MVVYTLIEHCCTGIIIQSRPGTYKCMASNTWYQIPGKYRSLHWSTRCDVGSVVISPPDLNKARAELRGPLCPIPRHHARDNFRADSPAFARQKITGFPQVLSYDKMDGHFRHERKKARAFRA